MSLDLSNIKATAGISGLVIKKIAQKSDGKVLWQAGSIVSYVTDVGQSYTEEVSTGASCLSPSRGNPTKSGWTFVGWREDGQANGSVLTNKVMGSDPIVLYAVYKHDVTVTFHYLTDAGTLATTPKTGTRYFNASGITLNASVTAPNGANANNWTWRGWSDQGIKTADAAVKYANGATVSDLTGARDIYGLYQKTCSARFISYNNEQNPTGTAYYNASGQVSQFTVTAPTGAAFSGWTWRGWSQWYDVAADANVHYANGATIDIHPDNSGMPFYGLYSMAITVSFNGNGATGGSVSAITKTRYYNAANNYSDPSFTLPANGFTRANSTFLDWASGSVGGARYAAGASLTLTASTTFYAKWRVSVPISASVGNTNFVVSENQGTRTLTPITLSPKYGGKITGAVAYAATGGMWTGSGFPAAATLYVSSNPSGISVGVAGSWNRNPDNISASMNVSNAASVSIIWSLTGSEEDEDNQVDFGFQYASQTLSGTEVYEV